MSSSTSSIYKDFWERKRTQLVPLFAGIAGGTASTISLYPLDLIKVRMQVNTQTQHNPSSILNLFLQITRNEGILGLYQGLSPALIGSGLSWGGYFYFYEIIKQEIRVWNSSSSSLTKHENSRDTNRVLSPIENFGAACISGAILVGLTNPIWLIKTRMQLQRRDVSLSSSRITTKTTTSSSTTTTTKNKKITNKPYKSMSDAFRTIIKEEGVFALYKGSLPALLLTSHGGVQFVTYEFLKNQFGTYKKQTSARSRRLKGEEGNDGSSVLYQLRDSAGYLTMGAVSKIVASTTTYPLQVIKSRIQQRQNQSTPSSSSSLKKVGEQDQYRGIISAVQRIFRKEGISGFFKGCIPNALRVAPSAAITFVVYESIIDLSLGG
eukprot:CAMPEP_0178959224 /NCGR_PEP_ID=MMETSP0789-20121207/12149_1 /TAXON_ID=3005 /ORGANISM="Rhizosolenia setigera, Strain CCMP 1694" /LENGTH=378 /DNA_ID=CAMNT_0020642157 /DNA_START=17 /DNA_END=1153 /DNA_ORIENTATION=+